jgi:hypothetical protein
VSRVLNGRIRVWVGISWLQWLRASR